MSEFSYDPEREAALMQPATPAHIGEIASAALAIRSWSAAKCSYAINGISNSTAYYAKFSTGSTSVGVKILSQAPWPELVISVNDNIDPLFTEASYLLTPLGRRDAAPKQYTFQTPTAKRYFCEDNQGRKIPVLSSKARTIKDYSDVESMTPDSSGNASTKRWLGRQVRSDTTKKLDIKWQYDQSHPTIADYQHLLWLVRAFSPDFAEGATALPQIRRA